MAGKNVIQNIFDYVADSFKKISMSVTFKTASTQQYFVPSSPEAYLLPVYTRIALDVAEQRFGHVIVDQNGTIIEDVDSTLNFCLREEPNKDEIPLGFIQRLVMELLQKGTVVIIPIEFELDSEGFESITSLNIGTLDEERVDHVVTTVYDDETGIRKQITVEKRMVAIIDNPLATVMSTNNATLKRLLDKINLLDTSTRKNNSGKLDMIIQLPYAIKSQTRKDLVDARMAELENQLSKSDLGIAYTEATERVVQLNRAVGGNLMGEIADLTTRLHAQLGITENFMIGVADPEEVRNYIVRTVKPITDAITQSMTKAFIKKSKRHLVDSGRKDIVRYIKERIVAERDVLEFLSIDSLLSYQDSLSRNEIVSPTEVRARVGFRPTGVPDADRVRNRNMPLDESINNAPPEEKIPEEE